jgi:hypothetical protein
MSSHGFGMVDPAIAHGSAGRHAAEGRTAKVNATLKSGLGSTFRTGFKPAYGNDLKGPFRVPFFNQFDDLERCALRPGNVQSAHGWRDVLPSSATGEGYLGDLG